MISSISTHCVARGLRPLTLVAYEAALTQFSQWIRLVRSDRSPDQVTARDVLEYLQHLREARGNGDAAVNRQLVILRSFYRAIVAMGHLEPAGNPLAGFPSIKAVPRKLPVSLAPEQVSRLLIEPKSDTVIGLRDRALLSLLYGTGIRASECASLTSGQVDLTHRMRHTFATHLVRAGVGLVTIRDLLGHRQITSTQIYLHVTAEDLRAAAARHPIGALLATVEHLLPTA